MAEVSTLMVQSAPMAQSTTMIQWLLPRAVLSILFAFLAFFAFFEGIYLRDQAAFFGVRAAAAVGANVVPSVAESVRHAILVWMWAFRAIALLLSFSCIAVFVRR